MIKDTLLALASILERENAALAAMDLTAAAALLPEKTAVLAALPDATPGAEADTARRVAGLAKENKDLLERAIAAQERVIGIVARAAVSVQPVYGGSGRARPVAISTRA